MHVIDNRAGLSAEALSALQDEVRGHSTLEKVVQWAMTRCPDHLVDTVIRQDEYTLDVVVPLDGSGLCLVYDTT